MAGRGISLWKREREMIACGGLTQKRFMGVFTSCAKGQGYLGAK